MFANNEVGQRHHTLASNTDGSTFAAKARAAELNASRAKHLAQARELAESDAGTDDDEESKGPKSFAPTSLIPYVVLTSRIGRGRRSKTPKLPELSPTMRDENWRLNSLHLPSSHLFPSSRHLDQPDLHQDDEKAASVASRQSLPSPSHSTEPSLSNYAVESLLSTSQRGQPIVTDQGIKTGTSLRSGRTRSRRSTRTQPTSLVPFPQVIPPDHQPLTLDQSEEFHTDRDHWPPSSPSDFKVVHVVNMPRSNSKPGTPASRGGKPRQPSYRPSSGSTKHGDDFRNHPTTDPMANMTSTNPNPSPLQTRLTPQQPKRGDMGGFTPGSQVSTGSQRSEQSHVLDNPFEDQAQSLSSNMPGMNATSSRGFSGLEQPYWPGDFHQNVPVGYFQQFPSQSPHYKPSPNDRQFDYARYNRNPRHVSHSQQSPYTKQSEWHHSSHESNAFAQPTEHGGQRQQSEYQQRAFSQQQAMNPRAAVRMPPPAAVKGTPSHDACVTVLHSTVSDTELQRFYDSTPEDQETTLDDIYKGYGPQQLPGATQHIGELSNHTSQDLTPDVRGNQSGQHSTKDSSRLRDPAPYTGFGASGNKKDMLLRNLDQAVETSKASGDLSGSARTVLHDPIAHLDAPGKMAVSANTASTLKPMAPSFQQTNPQVQTATEESTVGHVKKSLEPRDLELSGYCGDNLLTGNHHFTQSQPSLPSVGPGHGRASAISHELQPSSENTGVNSFQTATQGGNLSRVSGQYLADFESAEETERLASETAMLEAQNIESILPKFLKLNSAHPLKGKQIFPNHSPIKYTATGLPIPHGGFADFTTPYDVNFFKKAKDYKPSNHTTQGAGNIMIRSIVLASSKPAGNTLEERAEWFHSTTDGRDLNAVKREFEVRMGAVGLSERPTQTRTTPKALPKPIGDERKSFSGSSRPSNPIFMPTKTRMEDLTAKDGMDLMAGPVANLIAYAEGSAIGDHFARWGRPPEWAIDRSAGGNKSLLGGGYETAPLRAGRDSRFPKVKTGDGRETHYAEEPGRGKGRGRC